MIPTTPYSKQIFLVCCFVISSLLTLTLRAQFACDYPAVSGKSSFSFIYRLTPVEAAACLHDGAKFDSTWLHTLVDTIWSPAFMPKGLDFGHYLLVRVEDENLIAEYYDNPGISVNLLNTQRGFACVVMDENSQPITNAKVMLKGKKVPYDTKLGCYFLKKRKKGGLLKVYANDQAVLMDIRNEYGYRGKQQKWKQHRILGYPHRLTTRTKWKIRAIKEGYYDDYRRNKRKQKKAIFYIDFEGYTALNQPKYQPGDTLRLSAYLTDRYHKPINQPVELTIDGGDKQIKRILNPEKPGEFTWVFPLSDSLKLDRNYDVNLTAQKRHKTGKLFPKKRDFLYRMTQSFKYEDYQLDAMSYSVGATKPSYFRGENAELNLSAKDPNGQPAPDIDVKMVFLAKIIHSFEANEVYVKDTLWQHRTMMPPTNTFSVMLPDSVLPKATISILAKAYFTNTAGEMQEKTATFMVHALAPVVEMCVINGMFKASFRDSTKAPDKAIMTRSYGNQSSRFDTVILPLQTPLDPLTTYYNIAYNDQNYSYSPQNQPSRVNVYHVRENDSLVVRFSNPNLLDLHYWISRDKAIIAEGNHKTASFVWIQPKAGVYLYEVHYSYIWAGEQQSGSIEILYYDGLLNLTTDQPETISPGDAMNVTIKVTDVKNEPVEGVHLTTGAYNSQFGSQITPYQSPNIRIKRRSSHRKYDNFEGDIHNSATYKTALTEDWVNRFNLKDSMYYRLRYSGCFHQEITDIPLPANQDTSLKQRISDINRSLEPLYLTWPQFAPWVVRDHKVIPAHLIYANGQLLYFSGNTDQQPYSFYANPGWNKLMVRTHDAEYTLDSVWMESGKKYQIAFNESCTKVGKVSMKSVSKPDSLLRFERDLLRNSMFILKAGQPLYQAAIWSSQKNVHRICNNYAHATMLGPFQPYQDIQMLTQGKLFSRFNFEPGFEYVISEGRERLYASKAFTTKYPLSKTLSIPRLKQLAWGIHQVYQPLPKQLNYIYSGSDQRGTGSIQFELPQDLYPMAFAMKQDTIKGPFNNSIRRIDGLTPGNHTLMIYNEQKEVATVPFVVRRDELTFKRLHHLNFQKAGTSSNMDSIFTSIFIDPKPNGTSQFSQIMAWNGNTLLSGIIRDESGEGLIGVTVKLMQGTVLIRGCISDFDGYYRMQVPPGNYDVEVTYTGYQTHRVTNVYIQQDKINTLDHVLNEYATLQEVQIISYKVPLIQQDATSSGQSLTSAQIRNLPTRSVNAIVATTAGTTSIDGDEVKIKGSRANSTNYYIDGVRVSGAPPPLIDLDVLQVQVRSTFRDYAYFQPHLTTNSQGEATFRTVFPDDITAWNTFILAMDGKGRGGIATMTTKAFKKVSAQLSVPRFAVAGDRFDMAGLTNNRSGDSLEVKTAFKQQGQIVQQNSQRIGAGFGEFASVLTPADLDSMTLGYEMRSVLNTDGEERKVPVLPVGTKESVGDFWYLESDTSFVVPINPGLGTVTAYAEDNALDVMLKDVEYLKSYPYGCNEQTSSRLIALLLLKKVKTLSGQPFTDDKLVRQCIARLQENQRPEGAWGWWANGVQNTWMTAYVLKALNEAKVAGYTVTALDKGIIWLRLYAPAASIHDQRYALITLRELGVNVDCTTWIKPQYAERPNQRQPYDVYTALSKWRIAQLCEKPVPKDSLMRYLQPHSKGGLSCAFNEWHWYNSNATTTLLAYDIADKAGWADITKGIRRYWLSQRSQSQYRNTIETAQVLVRLLPHLMRKDSTGKVISRKTTRLIVGQEDMDVFPKKISIVPMGQEALQVKKTGDLPLFISISQTFHNPIPNPKTDLFDISTSLKYDDRVVDKLRRGEGCQLVVKVEVKEGADYVMIEVPIPAGCGYGEKSQKGRPYGNPEVHREYFKDRTVIFCERLSVGKYFFAIALEPRFSGRFTLNPARAEQMYFPTLYGRNGGKVVDIER